MPIVLRPHHLLDILRDYGYGIRYEPHEYGHALHTVAGKIFTDPDREIVLVVAADDVCRPCRHLRPGGQCDDTMEKDGIPVSKQAYNDALDRRLWAYLGLEGGNRMTVGDFLVRVRNRLEGMEDVCAHPGEDREYRKIGLVEGLKKLSPAQ
jgi:hypothetical protein